MPCIYYILRWMDWCDASTYRCARRTAPHDTLRYVYGICLTWLINSPSMAWSSATPEFRSGRTSRDLETFTSHVTYTSCDVDTLRTTSSQRCHSCVTFVCWDDAGVYCCASTDESCSNTRKWIYKNTLRLHIDNRIPVYAVWLTLHDTIEFRGLRELYVTGLNWSLCVKRKNNTVVS